MPFDIANWSASPYEFRILWNGSNDIRVIKIELQHL